jgi:hypothetical protein
LSGIEAEPSATVTPIEPADDDSFVEIEEARDDKMRRIAKTLQAGDVVEQAHVSAHVLTSHREGAANFAEHRSDRRR